MLEHSMCDLSEKMLKYPNTIFMKISTSQPKGEKIASLTHLFFKKKKKKGTLHPPPHPPPIIQSLI